MNLVDDDTLEIVLSPALPDHGCYTISIPGAVQNLALQPPGGDTDCVVRSLAGDVTGDGVITLSDAVMVRGTPGSGSRRRAGDRCRRERRQHHP